MVPAAVMNMGKNLGSAFAAVNTALYPFTVAWKKGYPSPVHGSPGNNIETE